MTIFILKKRKFVFPACCIIYTNIFSVNIIVYFLQFIQNSWNTALFIVSKAEIIILFLTPKLSYWQNTMTNISVQFSTKISIQGQSSHQKSREFSGCLNPCSPLCSKDFLHKDKPQKISKPEETTAVLVDSSTECIAKLYTDIVLSTNLIKLCALSSLARTDGLISSSEKSCNSFCDLSP